jgi:hypothetical protein
MIEGFLKTTASVKAHSASPEWSAMGRDGHDTPSKRSDKHQRWRRSYFALTIAHFTNAHIVRIGHISHFGLVRLQFLAVALQQ